MQININDVITIIEKILNYVYEIEDIKLQKWYDKYEEEAKQHLNKTLEKVGEEESEEIGKVAKSIIEKILNYIYEIEDIKLQRKELEKYFTIIWKIIKDIN